MRLFLSSQDFGNYPDVAAKMAGSNKKAAYIKNAQDDLPPQERNFSTPEKKKMFESAGFGGLGMSHHLLFSIFSY